MDVTIKESSMSKNRGKDPVEQNTVTGEWYFWDECWSDMIGPWGNEKQARKALNIYAAFLNEQCEKMNYANCYCRCTDEKKSKDAALQAAKGVLPWLICTAEHNLPPAPDHTCGPESCCDYECEIYALGCKQIQKSKSALALIDERLKGGK